MRRPFDRNLFLFLTALALVCEFAVGQQPAASAKPTPFLLQLGYLNADFYSTSTSTCIAVMQDGHFHLEESRVQPGSVGTQVFEGALSDKSMKSLSELLELDDLRRLKSVEDHPHFIFPKGPFEARMEGEVVRAIIPRPEGLQDLSLGGTLGGIKHPTPLPAAVKPLTQWIRATAKEVERQRGSLIKGGKLVDCWVPEP